MKRILIRQAGIDDAEAIAGMVGALSAAEGEPAPRFDAATCRRDGFGDRPLFRVWIAEVEGRVAGYALHHRSYDTDRVVRAEWLSDLYVENWARNEGLGIALISAIRGTDPTALTGLPLIALTGMLRRAGVTFFRH